MAATAATLRERARLLAELRRFFVAREFVEVETPSIVPCPGLDVHLVPFEVPGAGWLPTSPELQMKRLLARGLPQVFQLARAFRREEEGAHHEREFTLLEWYRGPGAMAEVMADTEALVAHLARACGGERDGCVLVGEVDVTLPWPRVTVRALFERHAPDVDPDDPAQDDAYFLALVERIEPAIAATKRATFVTGWPARMASLARLDPDDPSVAERFEAYVGGLELCNGFGELVDPVEQRARFEADQAERRRRGLAVPPIDERFLEDLAACPPAAGNALGVDRLLMLLLGHERLEDVLAFARSDL